MALDPITRSDFNGDIFPPALYPSMISAIVGGNPFATSLTRYDTGTTQAVFGVISAVSGAQWIAEADPKPDLALDTTSLVVSAAELAGIAMLSDRAVRDTAVDLMAEVQRVLRTYFGRVLDDGLLHGSGTGPNPLGVFTFAAESNGADLWTATHAAKADIIGAGGTPSTIALPPSAISAEEARLDGNDHPLYPDGLTRFAGLDVVPVPALAADEALVYDASGTYLVVAEDFRITPSRDYAPAYQRDSVALRVAGQFAVAVPVPAASIRSVTIGSAPASRSAKKAS